MSKLKYIITTTILLLIISTSCRKTHSVNISISKPTPNQVYAQGDTVFIHATVNSKAELHGYTVKIKDKASGIEVFNKKVHEHKSAYQISEKWVNQVTNTSDMLVTLDVQRDHHGDVVSQQVAIRCNK